MYRDTYGRIWEGPFPFNPEAIISSAPKKFGVYQILYNYPVKPMVAYIGIATGATIMERLLRHSSGRGNWALGRLSEPDSFRFVYYCCDEATAREIESHVTCSSKPPFNVKREYRHFIPQYLDTLASPDARVVKSA